MSKQKDKVCHKYGIFGLKGGENDPNYFKSKARPSTIWKKILKIFIVIFIKSNPTAADGDVKLFFASQTNWIGKIIQNQLRLWLNGCKLVQNYPKV